MMPQRNWAWAALPLAAAGALLCFAPAFLSQARSGVFVAMLLLLSGELAVIGLLVNGRPVGAFIDNRNMLSLSKLQAGAWTVLVLSAFSTAVAFNAVAPGGDYATVTALKVVIPGDLLLAMGISATSLVATPALLSLKAAETPAADAEQGAADRTGKSVAGNGKLVTKTKAADASWADLVTGDELGNAGTPDLGKIQQALISLVLIGAYAGYVVRYFAAATPIVAALPPLDQSFVWLLGLSHASYLAYKAAPHTPGEDAPRSKVRAPDPPQEGA